MLCGVEYRQGTVKYYVGRVLIMTIEEKILETLPKGSVVISYHRDFRAGFFYVEYAINEKKFFTRFKYSYFKKCVDKKL